MRTVTLVVEEVYEVPENENSDDVSWREIRSDYSMLRSKLISKDDNDPSEVFPSGEDNT